MRHGLHRLARREAAQRWQGGSPRLCANPSHLYLEAVRRRSGGGPMWIAQMPYIKALARIVFWLRESLSASCLDWPATALGRRRPGEYPTWIA